MMRFRAPSLVLAGAAIFGGCKEYRVEYVTVPSYYQDAVSEDDLSDGAKLSDGTTIVYQTRSAGRLESLNASGGEQKVFEPIVEREDGSCELHAVLPEHVLGNFIYCLNKENYEACWSQVLSEATKQAMAASGEGYEEFAAFLQRNRKELLVTCNRLALGLPRQDTILEPGPNGIIRLKFRPHIAKNFAFHRFDMINEGFELKLLVIK